MTPITSRNVAETVVPTRLPISWNVGMSLISPAEIAMRTVRPTTIDECPSEKKRPTPTGRWPSCMSFRVVLSIAAM